MPQGILEYHGLEFFLVTSSIQIRQVVSQWRDLVDESRSPDLMLQPHWMLTWWDNYHHGRELAVGLFYCGNQLVGLAPLCRSRHAYAPGLTLERLALMSASGADQDGVRGEYLNIIAHREYESEVASAFAQALASGCFGKWDECVLEPLDGSASFISLLSDMLQEKYPGLERTQIDEASVVTLPATWEAYLESLHKKRRYWMRKTTADFQEWVGDRGYRLRRTRDRSQLESDLKTLADLHEERWKHAGRDGAFSRERFRRFHWALAPQLLEAGELELSILEVGRQPVAAHYNFVSNDKMLFYQSGRSMSIPQRVGIGNFMIILQLQSSIARGLREFDMLGGNYMQKSFFATCKRPLIKLHMVSNSTRSNVWRVLRSVKRAGRHVLLG